MGSTDDQGPWAVPWNMPKLHMPQLAKLAQEGTRFDSFYCASPVCSPAKASLLTGRMPSAHGVHDFLTGTNHPRAYPDTFLESQLTFPQVLASGGYDCAMIGKWHVGDSQTLAPGFNHWFAHRFGGGPYYHAPIWDEDGNPTTEPRYFTEAIAEEAEAYLDGHAPPSPKKIPTTPGSTGGGGVSNLLRVTTSPAQIRQTRCASPPPGFAQSSLRYQLRWSI